MRRSRAGDRRLVVTGVGVVAASYLAVRSGAAGGLDAAATRRLASRGGRSDRVVAVATDLGSIFGAAGITAILAATGRRRAATDVALAAAVAWSAAQAAKPLLPRTRPYQEATATRLVSPPAGTAWPSGHTAVGTAVAVALAPRTPPVARAVSAVTVTAIAASRLRVGVHHLTDVVAGVGVGALAAGVTGRLTAVARGARRRCRRTPRRR